MAKIYIYRTSERERKEYNRPPTLAMCYEHRIAPIVADATVPSETAARAVCFVCEHYRAKEKLP